MVQGSKTLPIVILRAAIILISKVRNIIYIFSDSKEKETSSRKKKGIGLKLIYYLSSASLIPSFVIFH